MSSARDLGPSDLIWEHFSRGRTEDPTARVDAAAASGYAAIGLFIEAWSTLTKDAAAMDAFLAALDRTGLCVANIEALRGWSGEGGEPDPLCTVLEPIVWDMADRLGCRYLQAIGPYTGTIDEAAAGFGALCDRAAEHGLKVGLEFLPFTNIRTATEAMQIVEKAGRDNGGLCVDSWHLFRGSADLDEIRRLPGEKVFAVQLNDGSLVPANPNYYEDCLTNRVTPGAGEFDLVGLISALDAIGSTAPLGLEVCSSVLWAQPIEVAAALSAQGMRGVLALARPTPGAATAAAGLPAEEAPPGEELPTDGMPADGMPADGMPADGPTQGI